MSVTYGFYDSVNHDRKYNAQQMSAIFDGIINDGVFASIGNKLVVAPTTGLTVKVQSGRAWFNHTWTYNDADYPLTLDAADLSLNRIDAIVLEVNNSTSTRANSFKIVKGTATGTPTKPTLTNTTDVHQHALAYVTLAAGTTTITTAMIENCVGLSTCPFITGILETADVSFMFDQWYESASTRFEAWFSELQNELDENQAANLQNQINNIYRIGDIKITSRADMANNWLLANGDIIDGSEWSGLAAQASGLVNTPNTCTEESTTTYALVVKVEGIDSLYIGAVVDSWNTYKAVAYASSPDGPWTVISAFSSMYVCANPGSFMYFNGKYYAINIRVDSGSAAGYLPVLVYADNILGPWTEAHTLECGLSIYGHEFEFFGTNIYAGVISLKYDSSGKIFYARGETWATADPSVRKTSTDLLAMDDGTNPYVRCMKVALIQDNKVHILRATESLSNTAPFATSGIWTVDLSTVTHTWTYTEVDARGSSLLPLTGTTSQLFIPRPDNKVELWAAGKYSNNTATGDRYLIDLEDVTWTHVASLDTYEIGYVYNPLISRASQMVNDWYVTPKFTWMILSGNLVSFGSDGYTRDAGLSRKVILNRSNGCYLHNGASKLYSPPYTNSIALPEISVDGAYAYIKGRENATT